MIVIISFRDTYPLIAGPRIHSNMMSPSIMYLLVVLATFSVPVNTLVRLTPAKMKQLEEA